MSRDWIDAHETDEYLIDYLFDLNGYLIIKGAIAPQDLQEMNQWVDEHWDYVSGKRRSTNDEAGTWIGNIETHTYSGPDGCNFQNIICFIFTYRSRFKSLLFFCFCSLLVCIIIARH